jgi:surface protein
MPKGNFSDKSPGKGTTTCSPSFNNTSLRDAVADYFIQECLTNTTCVIITKYGAIGEWCTSVVTDMSSLFSVLMNAGAASFNEPLAKWNIRKVTTMNRMFYGASAFNQPLATWNVENVGDMSTMFYVNDASSFNQPLAKWNVGKVEYMDFMFASASSFNQPLAKWNVGKVTDMSAMFNGASAFNQPLAKWNVGKVTDMKYMFASASAFNQPLARWNVGNVMEKGAIFYGASAFNQDLCAWGKYPTFPYDADDIDIMFDLSACTNLDGPTETNKGPF